MSFTNNLSWRYATKKFDLNRSISKRDKEKILEAIRLAPSSFGLQPYHINVIEDKGLREKLSKAAYDQPQINSCSFLLVFSRRSDLLKVIDEYIDLLSGGDSEKKKELAKLEKSRKDFAKSMDVKETAKWTSEQTYISLGFALAACADLSIDSCPMGGFDRKEFKKILKLSKNLYPEVIMTVGYRSGEDRIRPKARVDQKDLFTLI